MNSDLISAIKSALGARTSVDLVSSEHGFTIIEKVEKRFIRDLTKLWWWEALSVSHEHLEYGDADVGDLLHRTLEEKGPSFYLVITGDQPRPWNILRGSLSGLIAVIRETWAFEYFLLDDSFSWLLSTLITMCLLLLGTLGYT